MMRTSPVGLQASDVALCPEVRRSLSGEKAQAVVALGALQRQIWYLLLQPVI